MIQEENIKYLKKDLTKSLILSLVSLMVLIAIYLFVNFKGVKF